MCQASICLWMITFLIMIFRTRVPTTILQIKCLHNEAHFKITSRLHNNEHQILITGTGVIDLPARTLSKTQAKATIQTKTSQDSRWVHPQAGRISCMRMIWEIFRGHSHTYRINCRVTFTEGRRVWWQIKNRKKMKKKSTRTINWGL